MSIKKHIENATYELTEAGEKVKRAFYLQPKSRDSAKLHRQYHSIKKLIEQLENIDIDDSSPDIGNEVPMLVVPDNDYFVISRKDMPGKAYGVLEGSCFKVLAGSYIAQNVVANMYEIVKRLREEHAVSINGSNILTKDISFDNPGQAARFVTGKQVTGTDEWKTPNGIALKDYSPNTQVVSSETTSSEYAFKKPVEITIFQEQHKVSSWKDVLITVCECIHKRHPSIVMKLPSDNRLNSKRRATFGNDKSKLKVKPVQLSCGIWVETNQSAASTLRICHKILSLCGYEPSMLKVETNE